MMTHAYDVVYLNDAKSSMSEFFDYLVNDCGFEADWAASVFVASGYAGLFERGNPGVVACMSGVELARAAVEKVYAKKVLPARKRPERLSPEYWAGWTLAEYQWYSGHSFASIFSVLKFSGIVSLYPVFHEMDVMRFVEYAEERFSEAPQVSRLKVLRESRGLSQSRLAEASGVSLRSIQMYEQGHNDIEKAQGNTLYRLSRVIGCSIEDLICC